MILSNKQTFWLKKFIFHFQATWNSCIFLTIARTGQKSDDLVIILRAIARQAAGTIWAEDLSNPWTRYGYSRHSSGHWGNKCYFQSEGATNDRLVCVCYNSVRQFFFLILTWILEDENLRDFWLSLSMGKLWRMFRKYYLPIVLMLGDRSIY